MKHTLKKFMILIIAALMMSTIIVSVVKADVAYRVYPDSKFVYGEYNPYRDYTYYRYDNGNAYPVAYGPYPQYYLVQKDKDIRFMHDDYNHFDEFVSYKDLDVYYPGGRVDVIRNEYADELDLSDIDTSMKSFGEHVTGYLPGGAIYTKHYGHDHSSGCDYGYYDDYYYGYDYGYGNAYYTPYSYYSNNKPVYSNPCQQIGACASTHGCC